jgi:hypothetical protein
VTDVMSYLRSLGLVASLLGTFAACADSPSCEGLEQVDVHLGSYEFRSGSVPHAVELRIEENVAVLVVQDEGVPGSPRTSIRYAILPRERIDRSYSVGSLYCR